MRAADLRVHLAARIAAASTFKHADGLIGIAGTPRTRITPAFEVELLEGSPVGDRQRASSSRTRRMFAVRLLHAGNPARGIEQWDAALDDEATVRRALQKRDPADSNPLLCVENSIVYVGTDRPEILSGGEYRRTTLMFHIDYSEELE